jgi:hypothetical protein
MMSEWTVKCVIGLCVSLKIIFFRPMGFAEFGNNLSLFFLVNSSELTVAIYI